MKTLIGAMICALFLSPAIFGQEIVDLKHLEEDQKHPEKDWIFLFHNLSGDGNFLGFSVSRSNYEKNQHLGLIFYGNKDSKKERSENSFSYNQEIDVEIEGYVVKDTIKIEGKEESIKTTRSFLLDLDLKFLPDVLHYKKKLSSLVDFELGAFVGGGVELNMDVVTQQIILYFKQGNDGMNSVKLPTVPTNFSVDYGPYINLGVYSSLGRLMFFCGGKSVFFSNKGTQTFFISSIGMRF